ncbi:MAG: methyltransferase domain-containing protein [Kangiellaceae bacterium]|nr:methyltransferase domain-containing protein [Kangiellaceae bacterium]MCW9000851.1 methyltransferase domain-containing protein [Kangiellaceae bacterium]
MNLFQEYKKQQEWRGWERFLQFIPVSSSDSVVDLGCSVGGVTRLLSSRVKNVLGIDINQEFIDFCEFNKCSNESFICTDFQNLDGLIIESVNGIWSSFSLSYLRNPLDFLISVKLSLEPGGWIALLDVSCFISGNLSKSSKYYKQVRSFELDSYKSGIYDYNFGTKMQDLLQSAGFEIVHVDNDVTDPELNFSGAASKEIVEGWVARLNRMQRLKEKLGAEYTGFCNELLSGLGSEDHEKSENVRFFVAKKI